MIKFLTEKAVIYTLGGAAAALGALNAGKVLQKYKPAIVGGCKETYAFKDWLCGQFEALKEDVEDIKAESLHEYYAELEAANDSEKMEKKIWGQLEELIAAKKATSEKEESKSETTTQGEEI